MKREHMSLYAAVLALAAVGALAVGVSPSTLVLAALVLACPLMMLFMHGGHSNHGGDGCHGDHREHGRQRMPDARHDDGSWITRR